MRKPLRRNGKRLISVVLAGLTGIVGAVAVASPAHADWVRDFNGDGRGDLTALFDWGNGAASLWVFPGTTAGIGPDTVQPYQTWGTLPGNFWLSVTKSVGGDFTGDGRKDVMVMYDYGNGSAGLFVIPGIASPPAGPHDYRVWFAPPGNFWLHEAKLAAGDFNGDGRDDVLALYNYGNGQTGMWVWPGTTARGDGASEPYMVWESQVGHFWVSDVEITGGDFNGDGRDDLIALYDYPDHSIRLFVIPGVATGGTAPQPVLHTCCLDPNRSRRAQLTSTNYDFDGKDDVYVLTGLNLLLRFRGTDQIGDQATSYEEIQFGTEQEDLILLRSRITSGDFRGDGVPDLIGMYDVGDGRTAMWIMGVGLFFPQLLGVWVSDPGELPMNRTTVTS